MLTSVFGQYYYHPMMDNQDWGWSFGMMLVWFVILVLVAAAVLHILRGSHSHDRMGKSSPLDIAKERYAKGEIKKDEFEQIKKDLASH